MHKLIKDMDLYSSFGQIPGDLKDLDNVDLYIPLLTLLV